MDRKQTSGDLGPAEGGDGQRVLTRVRFLFEGEMV